MFEDLNLKYCANLTGKTKNKQYCTGLVLQPLHIHVLVHIKKCIYLNGLYGNVISYI